MTQFGQSLPALPQVYSDQQQYTFTKAGFVSHITRALETIGMTPVRAAWPWDPTASPEFVVPDPTVALFPFDYPDSATFSINGDLWRPCFVIGAWFGEYTTSNAGRKSNFILFADAIRQDGVFTLGGMYIMNRTRNPAELHFGFGAVNETFSTDFSNTEGAYIEFNDWKPYASFAGSPDTQLLSVGNIYAYLGRAGLFLYIGSGTSEAQFGDLTAMGCVFGGGRIPDREITPDFNLNRINPVVPLYAREQGAGSDQYDTSTGRYRTLVHGIQHDGKFTFTPVRAYLFNLENIEYPIFPDYGPFTVPSPREVSGGGGAHILGRVTIVPFEREDDPADLYGPTVPELSASEVRPQWGEVFTAPNCRFSDRTAPLGLNEDPVTLTDWYLLPTYNALHRVCLYYENAQVVSALAVLAKTATGDDYYTMAGTPGLTFPSLGVGLTAPTVSNTTSASPAVSVWDDSNAADIVSSTTGSGSGNHTSTLDWTVALPAGDPEDTVYEVEFEARNRNGAATEGLNVLTFETYTFGAYATQVTLASAGTNTGAAAYNFQTFVRGITIDSTVPGTRQLRFRWQLNRPSSGIFGNTADIQNVHVKKYRYL